MRLAVLSDIHANLEALDAVLERVEQESVGAVYVLGDIVGYGADPLAVVQRLTSIDDVMLISGNHDLAACGRFDTRWFNTAARTAIEWTVAVLDEQTAAVLSALEPREDAPAALCVHGSVVDPAAEYVVNTEQARRSFDADTFVRCFFGHTHLPTVFIRARDGSIEGTALVEDQPVSLDGAERMMLNPGSVGQPRDADPRASFMVVDLDAGRAVLRRVTYDVPAAQRKIRAAGLPTVLADRLAVGR